MQGPRPEVMGEIFSDALPTEDPVLYGHAEICSKGAFEADSHRTFTITYTTSRYGIDDTGTIKIVFRFPADGGDLQKGCLREGDAIVVLVGNASGGSPGDLLQSRCETAFTWRVLADVCATGHFVPMAESPTIQIVPGPPAIWKAVLPSLKRPGETFRLGIKAEGLYGNP